MDIQTKYRRGSSVPVIVAVSLAIVGQALVLFNDFGPGNVSRGSGTATMITAAALSRAGAIEIPTAPPARRPTA
jgi:hypothetical protein